jgi:hypothetical protein
MHDTDESKAQNLAVTSDSEVANNLEKQREELRTSHVKY